MNKILLALLSLTTTACVVVFLGKNVEKPQTVQTPQVSEKTTEIQITEFNQDTPQKIATIAAEVYEAPKNEINMAPVPTNIDNIGAAKPVEPVEPIEFQSQEKITTQEIPEPVQQEVNPPTPAIQPIQQPAKQPVYYQRRFFFRR